MRPVAYDLRRLREAAADALAILCLAHAHAIPARTLAPRLRYAFGGKYS